MGDPWLSSAKRCVTECSKLQRTFVNSLRSLNLERPTSWPMPYPENFMMMQKTSTITLMSCSLCPLPFRFSLFYQGRIVIPTVQMQQQIMTELHSSPVAGHSGIHATVARIPACFYWTGLYKDTKTFVSNCITCQENKTSNQKKAGLLQPLPVPKRIWEDLSMDFITHLPQSFGHSVIWVICDRLSKSVHFVALPSHFQAQDLARRFAVEVFRLHGCPKSIISDRDPLFMSTFWRELFVVLRMRTHETGFAFFT